MAVATIRKKERIRIKPWSFFGEGGVAGMAGWAG